MNTRHIFTATTIILLSSIFSISANAEQACLDSIPKQDSSRFSISADGTEVTDSKTGLIWQRCSIGQTWDGSTCKGEASNLTWKSALEGTKAVGEGYRLPTIKESMSIVDYSCTDPALNSNTFPNVPASTMGFVTLYWTSTPLMTNGSSAVLMNYKDGSTPLQDPQMYSKASLYNGYFPAYARAVKNK